MRRYYTYIVASKSRCLYVGVTNNLERRMYEHVAGWSEFTARYHITRLVYYEIFPHPMQAIHREKRLKKLLRAEKVRLITEANPLWVDLADGWFGHPGETA
jgi:putative endonuclease